MTDLKSVAPNLPCILSQIFRFPRLAKIILLRQCYRQRKEPCELTYWKKTKRYIKKKATRIFLYISNWLTELM